MLVKLFEITPGISASSRIPGFETGSLALPGRPPYVWLCNVHITFSFSFSSALDDIHIDRNLTSSQRITNSLQPVKILPIFANPITWESRQRPYGDSDTLTGFARCVYHASHTVRSRRQSKLTTICVLLKKLHSVRETKRGVTRLTIFCDTAVSWQSTSL